MIPPARVLSRIKNALVTPGHRERVIRAGAFRGLRMQLDLQRHAQNYLGLYERELYAPLRELTQGIASAIDVGSADGSYVLYFLARTPARLVLAVEPDPAAYALLQRNLAANGFSSSDRVRLIAGTAGDGSAASIALDSLLDQVHYPTVVKVDVEGAEADVLRGAGGLMRRGPVAWLIETHSTAIEAECLSILREHGYAPRVITPAWWRLVVPETRPIPHNRWIVADRTRSPS